MAWTYPKHASLPSYVQINAWCELVRQRNPADILIGYGDQQLPFLHISPPSLERVPLAGLDTGIIERCCWEVAAWIDRSAKINIGEFKFPHVQTKADISYAFRVARAVSVAVDTLQEYVSVSTRSDESATKAIKSVSRFTTFNRYSVVDSPLASELYISGLRDGHGRVQSRAAGWILGAPRSYGCILGTSLPSAIAEVPPGKVLRGELWALMLTMMRAKPNRKDPGPCFVMSFTDTHARIVVGKYRSSRTKGHPDYLEVQVALNERFIFDAKGSYNLNVYHKLLGWGFFRRMKEVRKQNRSGYESGWISRDYDTAGFLSGKDDED